MKRIILLLFVACSFASQGQGIRFLMASSHKYSPPVVHNDYVQAVIDQATTDGNTSPNETTLAGLDAFFDDIESVMSKADMIKIGLLWDTTLQFTRYNFVNPSTYKDTYPAGKPVYGLRGWSSNGTTYINNVITMKRRPDIPTNSSSIAIMDAYNNASVDQAACGSVSGNYYMMKPYLSGGGIYYLTSTTAIAPVTTTHNVFMSLSTNGASGTRARLKQNSTYANFGSNLTGTEMTNDLPVFTCAYNNAGSPLRWYTQGNVQFRWEGQELSDAEIDLIQTAWNTYVASVTQTSWTPTNYTTSDGKEVWLVCADSKGGTSTAVGRYALPNTVFQRLRSGGSITEVKGADLADIPSTGSWMPLFGRLYNERAESKGKRIVFAHYAWGGSAFLNDFKAASWDEDDSGLLYPLAKVVWDAALSTMSLTKPAGIIVILGINDMNESMSISLTEAEMDNLFNRLNTDYGSPPIYVSIPSVQTLPGNPQLTRLNTIRAKLASIASINSNITIFEDEATDVFDDPANTSDGSHFNFTGNETVANNLIESIPDIAVSYINIRDDFIGGHLSEIETNTAPTVTSITESGTYQEGEVITIVLRGANNSTYPIASSSVTAYRGTSPRDLSPTTIGSSSGVITYEGPDESRYIATFTYTCVGADVGKHLKFNATVTLDADVNTTSPDAYTDYSDAVIAEVTALSVYDYRRLQIETVTTDGSAEGWSGWSDIANAQAVSKGATPSRLVLNGGSLTTSSYMDFVRGSSESMTLPKGTIGEDMEMTFVLNFAALSSVTQTIFGVSGTSTAYFRITTANAYSISNVLPGVSPSEDTWYIVRIVLNGASSFIQINNGSKTTFDSGSVSWSANTTSMFFGSSNSGTNYATMKMRFFGMTLTPLNDTSPSGPSSPWGLAYTKLNTDYMNP